MLRGFIRAFEKKYPDIQVKVTVSGSVWLMELLKTHQIDLGLMEDLPGETDTQLGIIGHMDVVPAGPGWTFEIIHWRGRSMSDLRT